MKKILLLFIIILLSVPVAVFGHTSLSESTPEDGETVQEPVEEIELIFEGTIEEQSTFEVAGENGEQVPAEVSIEESTLTGSLSQPLSNGSYTVDWTVVGADGHPVEGSFSFEVAGEENTAGEENATGSDTDEQGSSKEEDTAPEPEPEDEGTTAGEDTMENEQTNDETAASEQGTQGMSPVLIGLLILLGLIIILSGVWLVRRK